ncbi:MAG TPA: hypothetical protein VMG81_07775 [Thermoplasmata archaeon]|nr:hypothetical protein [Thermoplasmata archaeon]
MSDNPDGRTLLAAAPMTAEPDAVEFVPLALLPSLSSHRTPTTFYWGARP